MTDSYATPGDVSPRAGVYYWRSIHHFRFHT
jgi:hypothetical protein